VFYLMKMNQDESRLLKDAEDETVRENTDIGYI